MNSEMEMIRTFMLKHGHAINNPLPNDQNVYMKTIADRLFIFAKTLERHLYDTSDPRVLRAQLMCEELGEVIDAMADGNEQLLLDGLADLLYVVLGTGVAFDMPLVPAFHEVHRSNMTKEGGDTRVRHKGSAFEPPNLAPILDAHRRDSRQLHERNEIIRDLLLLVDRDVPLEVIQGWHWSTGELVSDWATAAHLAASDNDVPVPLEPLCLYGYKS